MAQQAAARPQEGAGQITLYTDKHPAIAYIFQPEVLPTLEQNLVGNKDGLTVKRIVIDLGAMLMANPGLAVVGQESRYTDKVGMPRVTPQTVYACVLEATRFHTTFGDGGLWLIPDDSGVPTLRPRQSEKFITQRANDDAKCTILRPVFVHKPDHPVTVVRDDASGDIVSFKLNPNADITEKRDASNLLGAFGRAKMGDDSIKIRWFDMADLERFRKHSSAPDSPAWKNDPLEMYARSVRAAVARELVPIRTRVPGMVSSAVVPVIEMEQAVDGEFKAPTAESAAADLAAMASDEPIPFGGEERPAESTPEAQQPAQESSDPVERAKTMFAAATTLEGLEQVWKSKAVQACMAEADSGGRKHIANSRAKREQEIREAAVAAARAQQEPPANKTQAPVGDEEFTKMLATVQQCPRAKDLEQTLDGYIATFGKVLTEQQVVTLTDTFNKKWAGLTGNPKPPTLNWKR